MAIPFSKYVNIISGVGGGAAVAQRALIGRIFTQSPLVDPNSVLEFSNADDVATFFGENSEEAARAEFYFGWVSPSISSAPSLSFARWATAAFAPAVYGGTDPKSLAALTALTAATLTVSVNGAATETTAAFSLAAAASLAAVAADVQTALNAMSDPMLTTATVTYDAVNQRFIVGGGTDGAGSIVFSGTTGDLGTLMELYTSNGAVNVGGSNVVTASAWAQQSANLSDNFGSFLFMGAQLALSDAQAISLWNASQNVKFVFALLMTAANASAWSAALLGTAGTAMTLQSPNSGEYPEMMPMIIGAAVDYTQRNAVANFMFKQFSSSTPSVLDGTLSDTYDALRVNYYGRTQSAGQYLDFYQRGTLTGTSTDPTDAGIYFNESWLKSAAGAAFMALLLAMSQVGATTTGAGRVKAVLQSVVDQALFNGTITTGKTLTTLQQLYVSQQTGDPLAWHQVQGIGYWMDVAIQSYATVDGRTEYKAVYTLIYSKADSIRMIQGTHTLI